MVSSRTAGGNSSRASCKQEHKYRRQLFVKLVPEETQLLCIDNCSLIKGTNVSQADLSHQKHTSLHETQLLHVCVCVWMSFCTFPCCAWPILSALGVQTDSSVKGAPSADTSHPRPRLNSAGFAFSL